jgi:hypothetical protein
VTKRLEQLRRWHEEWQQEDAQLALRASALNPDDALDAQRGMQIASLRIRLRSKLAYEPLELLPQAVERVGFANLRRHLQGEWVRRTDEERLLWLHNLLFIMTPDLRGLLDKLGLIRRHRALGQQRNFMLSGQSGAGKTTILDWYTYHDTQTVQTEFNRVKVVKVDAPVNNRSARPLFRRILGQLGVTYYPRNDDEELLEKIVIYFQKCQVELLIVDEIEQLVQHSIKRRLLEISNLVRGVPIVVASCHPTRWAEADAEIAGRWNDYYALTQYTNERLRELLTYLELFLPFSQRSFLALPPQAVDASIGKRHGKRNDAAQPDDIASRIQTMTGGILRDVMVLIMDASVTAILEHEPCLSLARLEATWRGIQTRQIWNFLPPATTKSTHLKSASGNGASAPLYVL